MKEGEGVASVMLLLLLESAANKQRARYSCVVGASGLEGRILFFADGTEREETCRERRQGSEKERCCC